jgi:hypothetical protein
MGYMKKNIYLDDVRTPENEGWIVVRDYDEFAGTVTLIGLENIELISLDHDLGDSAMSEYYSNVRPNYTLDYNNVTEKTGYDVCKFLVEHSMNTGTPLPKVVVHSANPIGAANMMGYINNYYKNCGQEEKCIRVQIFHTIDESKVMTLEERLAKWKK